MAITDINISEQLETSAPSIKYEGNEGPKSPEEQRVAQLKQEYMQYIFEQKDLQEPVMSFEEWYQAVYQASKMGVDAGQQPQPQPQMRQPVAYGGIMGVDGRRRYGWGSRLRKLIPNEVAKVAEVAAPFVAPFNPLAAGLMSGIGGFDRTGSIGKSIKSGLMNYGGGQLARGIGGGMGNLQTGFNPFTSANLPGAGTGTFSKYFSNPMQSSGGLGKVLSDRAAETGLANKAKMVTDSTKDVIASHAGDYDITGKTKIIEEGLKKGTSGIMDFINKNSTAILLGSMGIAAATATPQDMQEAVRVSRGTGLDIDAIRAEVQEAFAGGEEAWNELKNKYPYIGDFSTKKAEGGRIGLYAGGQSTPSDYTMEDAMMTTTQDKLGGITDIMKQADLYRQGNVGQFYAANGGEADDNARIEARVRELQDEGLDFGAAMAQAMKELSQGKAQGGRIGADEGGLMDLGGMEKDYRNDGGFVPIGGEEKADDVPARLSKNEFVFTADAVRGAGGGDIDKGAEIMENIMKNLEQGGQISEETQGLGGAQEMFDVSERLSEVV